MKDFVKVRPKPVREVKLDVVDGDELPVEDQEAQLDLVEDEGAMGLVRWDSHPTFRLVGVPG